MLRIILKNTVWFIILILLFANVFLFIKSIKLGDKTKFFEREIDRLQEENLELEKQAFYIDSLRYATSMAAEMKFTKRSHPIYLDNLKYAFRLGD